MRKPLGNLLYRSICHSVALLVAASARVLKTAIAMTLSIAVLTSGTASAETKSETIVTQRINQTNRLTPLKKVTVGPDDQYASTVDPTGKLVVFARKADLVTNLIVQNLLTGDVKELLPPNADSQEPAFGPKGTLAFTYFKFSARGDICYLNPQESPVKTADENEIQCIKRLSTDSSLQRSNPFWRSENQIGFLERHVIHQTSRIVSVDIRSGKSEVLVSGRVWSPSMQVGGKYLAYNELVDAASTPVRRMMVRDLQSSQTRSVQLALPGLSGFPVLSDDGRFLYFSHFMNDTNEDRAIDGSDNAVIFRLPIDRVLNAKTNEALFPEQLTSGESSCSFPRPHGDSVFATCAFEGSLDIYRFSNSGVVPMSWTPLLLENALQTSRSYAERVLILNTMRSRGFTQQASDEKLFFNHLESDDTVAARYYLARLQTSSTDADRRFFRLVEIYLQGRELKNAEPTADGITREFREKIAAIDHTAQKVSGADDFKPVVRGLLQLFVNNNAQAEANLKQSRPQRPLEKYFRFLLADGVYSRALPKSLLSLLNAHREMIKSPDLLHESQLYYAVTMLKRLSAAEPSPEKRIVLLEQLAKDLPKAAQTLIRAESVSLKLIAAKEDKDKLTQYGELDRLMGETRADYFLRKALYVRAILNFSGASEFKYLTLVASNWLRYTANNDTEFIHAREVFSDSTLDQAYANIKKKNLDFAANFFYQSLSLTDDLESHYGYIDAMATKGQRSTIDDRYKNLRERKFIDDNMKFVEALLILIDAAPKAIKDQTEVQHFDEAIAKLKAMDQDRDSAVRYLLLGYCYLEKLLRTAQSADFDADFMQAAHRNLMLAYDLGRDNDRIKVSALMNLGILHYRVQNYGLSTRFFSIRKRLPFETADDKAAFAWLYARSLDHSHQSSQAAAELEGVAASSKAPPILERQAFSTMIAGRAQESAALYEKLLKLGQVNGDKELAKVLLASGYANLMAGQKENAERDLVRSLEYAGRLSFEPKSKDMLIDFDPARIQLVGNGLLAQVAASDETQIRALQARASILEKNPKVVDDWRSTLMQTRLRIAELKSKIEKSKPDVTGAANEIAAALTLAEEQGKENGFLGHAIFRTIVSSLAHGITNPTEYAKRDSGFIKKVTDACIAAYDQQKIKQGMLEFQKLKLQVLWSGYSRRVLGTNEGSTLAMMESSASIELVKTGVPEQYKELVDLARAIDK